MIRYCDILDDRSPDELVDAMADCLFRAALQEQVDLGDERSVDTWLTRSGYGIADVHSFGDLAIGRARLRLQRRAAMRNASSKVADTAAMAILIMGWSAAYCVLCPPARAAEAAQPIGAVLNDVALASLVIWAPVIIVAGLFLIWCWREPTVAWGEPEAVNPIDEAPPTAPTLLSLEQRLRNADRG